MWAFVRKSREALTLLSEAVAVEGQQQQSTVRLGNRGSAIHWGHAARPVLRCTKLFPGVRVLLGN